MRELCVKGLSRGLRGEISVPGDKSLSHRAVMLGALASGVTRIRHFLTSEDCRRTVHAFQAMGIRIEEDRVDLLIHGKGLKGLEEPQDVLDMGNSGTSARLLSGILSGQPFFSVMTGDASLRRRPMGRVVEPLRRMGAKISGRAEGRYLPMAIAPGRLGAISYELPVPSAQVKSALLLAGLFAEGTLQVTEPVVTRDHTERMLTFFGGKVDRQENRISLAGDQRLEGRDVTIAGDISSAAFFLVGALVTPQSDVWLRGVGMNPTRIGILDVLQDMGAGIEIVNVREESGEPVADLHVRHAALKGVRIAGDRIPRLIDEIPILCVAATAAEGETVIQDAEELRVKESDRIETMAVNLRALGAEIETRPDGFCIQGGRPLRGAVCRSYGDHRVAMAMAMAGLSASGETQIIDTDCIQTSFPGFEGVLAALSDAPVGRAS